MDLKKKFLYKISIKEKKNYFQPCWYFNVFNTIMKLIENENLPDFVHPADCGRKVANCSGWRRSQNLLSTPAGSCKPVFIIVRVGRAYARTILVVKRRKINSDATGKRIEDDFVHNDSWKLDLQNIIFWEILIIVVYSQTCLNDHLRIATSLKPQRPAWSLLTTDIFLTTLCIMTMFFRSQGWPLCIGLTVCCSLTKTFSIFIISIVSIKTDSNSVK